MPYSGPFKKILRKFDRLYEDGAKAKEFAYREAFKENIKTYDKPKMKFKVLKKPRPMLFMGGE